MISAEAPLPVRQAVLLLFKGIVYRETNAVTWQGLLTHQGGVRDFVAVLGLELLVDESEGYAYLRQRREAEGTDELPRLVPRRSLTYSVSVLLLELRRKLVELDMKSGDTRLILSREEVCELMRTYLPDTTNETLHRRRVNADLNKVIDLGFVRDLGDGARVEVRRVLKAFIDASWLDGMLKKYQSLAGDNDRDGGADE